MDATISGIGVEATGLGDNDVFEVEQDGVSKFIKASVVRGFQGNTPLVNGQDYIDVVFDDEQPSDTYLIKTAYVINVVDSAPLRLWMATVTAKTTTGFRALLNGAPDSDNYFLTWSIPGAAPATTVATDYLFGGPTTGDVGVASSNFSVSLRLGETLTAPVVITPDDGGDGGTFTPTSVTLDASTTSATFTYTPASTGAKTISVTNGGGLSDPAPLTYTATLAVHLLNGLVSYWRMDDAGAVSGASTWDDAHGSNDLAGTNVPSTTGKLNGASAFDTTTNRNLQRASNSSLQVTGDFFFSFWAKPANNTDFMFLLGKNSNGSTDDDYSFYYSGTSAPVGFTMTVGNTAASINSAVVITADTWHHIVGWYDSSDQKLRLRIDDATTYTSAAATGALVQAAAAFIVGRRADGAVPTTGAIDELGLWKGRTPTAAEITYLFGGGTPPDYSTFTT